MTTGLKQKMKASIISNQVSLNILQKHSINSLLDKDVLDIDAGETMSISELFGLNAPRGLFGNSSSGLCTPPGSPNHNLQLNFDEANFHNDYFNDTLVTTSTPIRNSQKKFSLGSAGSSPTSPPSFYTRSNISFSDSSCPSNSPTVSDSPFPASDNLPDFGGNCNPFDVHLSDLLNSLTVSDNPNNSFGVNATTDSDLSYLQNLQALHALKYLQQIPPGCNQYVSLPKWSNGSSTLINANLPEGLQLERAARFHRSAASVYDAVCTWSGVLPKPTETPTGFSSKIFLGGVPWDISEQCLVDTFKQFGPVRVEWPCKNRQASQRKGYVYVIFECEKSVKSLLQYCAYDSEHWFFKMGSKRMKSKDIEVIPWALNEANYTKSTSQKLDPSKTVFVGALHGILTAQGLANIMNDLFDGVVYAGIDTDKYKYPIGSGRVTFNNPRSYMKAIAAAFIEIKTSKFTKKVQVDPYLEDSLCTICGVQQGPYFCRDILCFRYFCRSCWNFQHWPELRHHSPMSRNSKKGQQHRAASGANSFLSGHTSVNETSYDLFNSTINSTFNTSIDTFNN